MATMIERRYAMTRLGKGDYLLPSNDCLTLWRINSYTEDGNSTYSEDGKTWKKLRGTFWGVWRYNQPLRLDNEATVDEDMLNWERWDMWMSTCTTREEAIQEALRAPSETGKE